MTHTKASITIKEAITASVSGLTAGMNSYSILGALIDKGFTRDKAELIICWAKIRYAAKRKSSLTSYYTKAR